jgi:hypothetical protein
VSGSINCASRSSAYTKPTPTGQSPVGPARPLNREWRASRACGAMSSEWYIARDGNAHGPINETEFAEFLRRGHLRPSDYVWYDGWDDWRLGRELLPLSVDVTKPRPALPQCLRPSRVAPTRFVVRSCRYLCRAVGTFSRIILRWVRSPFAGKQGRSPAFPIRGASESSDVRALRETQALIEEWRQQQDSLVHPHTSP